LLGRLFAVELSTLEKKFHKTIPHKSEITYGTPETTGDCPRTEKNTRNTTSVNKGCINDQAIPSRLCR
jgi:hypothetical protein